MTSSTDTYRKTTPLTQKEIEAELLCYRQKHPNKTLSRRMKYEEWRDLRVENVPGRSLIRGEVEKSLLVGGDNILRWVCGDCGRKFDTAETSKVFQSRSHFLNVDCALCPKCGGMLQDLQQIVTEERARRIVEIRKRHSNRVTNGIIALLFILLLYLPGILEYDLLAALMLLIGPMKEIESRMKSMVLIVLGWGSVFLLMVQNVAQDFVGVTLFGYTDYWKALLLWCMVTAVLGIFAKLIETFSSQCGRLFYK